MQKFEKRVVQTTVALICDCCGRVAKIGGDDYEAQEYISIDFVGGYRSIFGDGTRVNLDICQYCLQDKILRFKTT